MVMRKVKKIYTDTFYYQFCDRLLFIIPYTERNYEGP